MADTQSLQASTSMAGMEEPPRSQAGPLPRKRGEIGYTEDIHGEAMARMDMEIAASRQPQAMGERHPADSPPQMNSDTASVSAPAPTNSTNRNASTTSISRMKRPRRPVPKIAGVMVTTLVRLLFQLLLLAGTGVGWAFSAMALSNQSPSQSGNDNSAFGGSSSTIFIHVAFGVVALAELVFLERVVFRVRAERYAHLHPGEMLPRARGRHMNTSMPMNPWQRPSLPTYAAALAQSGARTGDVEDQYIAQLPPPAYGKTRGSTVLLQGFLTAEHRRRARQYDEEAQLGPDGEPLDYVPESPRSVGSMVIVDRPSRPASYSSHDSEWDARMDMERAQAVEEALAAMEGVRPAHISDRDRP